MSFFDTLKQFGLWPQQGGQPQANPYGLDDGQMRQARMQSLSNLGSQIMAASVQQTPRQRAELMSGFDMSGGYQDNLYNAAQQKLMSAKMRAAQLELDQTEKMKISLANRLKSLPPGQLRDAAMWFYESGDYAKAGEILFKRDKVFNPYTMQDEYRDAFGNPVGGGSSPAAGPATAVPAAASGQPDSVAVPAAADGGAPALPPVTGGASSNQVTNTYRRIFQDPSLTDQEAMLIAGQGTSKEAIFKAYQEVLKQRVDAADKKRIATKDQSEMANTVLDDRRTQMETPQRIVDFAQGIEDALASDDPSGMAILATQVLFSKVLDPNSAFMTGEADLQKTAATLKQRVENWWKNQGGESGAPIPRDLAIEMRDISRQLGRRALTKLDQIDKEAKTRAGASGLTDDMLGGKFPLRWNRFADPVMPGTARTQTENFSREPAEQVLNDIENYGG